MVILFRDNEPVLQMMVSLLTESATRAPRASPIPMMDSCFITTSLIRAAEQDLRKFELSN